MKIAIDARFYGPEGTGIGRYLENLLRELEKIDSINQYTVLLRKNNFDLFNPKGANFKKILTDARWYSVKEQILVPAVLNKIKPDLVHFPHVNIPLLWGGKFVVTIHDLTKTDFGSAASSTKILPIYLIKNQGYKIVLNQALRRAEKILTPSKFVKEKISQAFQIPASKFAVTYEAADDIFVRAGTTNYSTGKIRGVLESFDIKRPFFLHVGNLFPYKNAEILLEALPKLDEKFSLVLVGGINAFTERFEKKVGQLKLEKRVRFTSYIPNEDLGLLYKQAEALVFPSLSEGFGLPGIEAMAVGCPVVAAEVSSLPEVYGKAALYFDPTSEEELLEKMNLVLDPKVRKELIKKGSEQAKQYSWVRLAQETLGVYTSVREKTAS